ncbi:MAG: serine/threonine protein kinase, partial [Clostridia bacterium]|nr:serine/threonine protein kinase [Clostridia bacterium]
MNYNNLCYRCFFEKPIADRPCPKCGYKHTPAAVSPNCLLPGTLLHGRYIVGVALGVGGFGITYKCLDTKIGGVCAIKEYFPANFAVRSTATKFVSVSEQNLERYNRVMKRFVEESRLLRKLQHPNVISTYDSFFENNTAYYVMEYCDGIDLRRYTSNFSKKLDYAEGMNLLFQIMNGLEYVHAKGILHRDIAPDNIYVTKGNSIKILDFGSARSEMDQYNRELSVIIKVGYAPIEQYGGRGKQGPYTDIYALGATFYHLFTSRMPVESTQRVAEDTLTPFSRLRPDLPDNLKYCIEKAMELTTAKRIANIAEM